MQRSEIKTAGPFASLMKTALARNRFHPALALAWAYLRFGIVGASGIIVDTGVLHVLHYNVGLDVWLAKLSSGLTAMIFNFVLHEWWTFRAAKVSHSAFARSGRWLRFAMISLSGLGLCAAVLSLLHDSIGWPLWISNLIGIGAASFWNFGLNHAFNWNRSADASESTPMARV